MFDDFLLSISRALLLSSSLCLLLPHFISHRHAACWYIFAQRRSSGFISLFPSNSSFSRDKRVNFSRLKTNINFIDLCSCLLVNKIWAEKNIFPITVKKREYKFILEDTTSMMTRIFFERITKSSSRLEFHFPPYWSDEMWKGLSVHLSHWDLR